MGEIQIPKIFSPFGDDSLSDFDYSYHSVLFTVFFGIRAHTASWFVGDSQFCASTLVTRLDSAH